MERSKESLLLIVIPRIWTELATRTKDPTLTWVGSGCFGRIEWIEWTTTVTKSDMKGDETELKLHHSSNRIVFGNFNIKLSLLAVRGLMN